MGYHAHGRPLAETPWSVVLVVSSPVWGANCRSTVGELRRPKPQRFRRNPKGKLIKVINIQTKLWDNLKEYWNDMNRKVKPTAWNEQVKAKQNQRNNRTNAHKSCDRAHGFCTVCYTHRATCIRCMWPIHVHTEGVQAFYEIHPVPSNLNVQSSKTIWDHWDLHRSRCLPATFAACSIQRLRLGWIESRT